MKSYDVKISSLKLEIKGLGEKWETYWWFGETENWTWSAWHLHHSTLAVPQHSPIHCYHTHAYTHFLSHANSPPSRTHPSLMHPWLPFTITISITGHANHFMPISCPPSYTSHYLLLFIQSATKCTLPITPSYHISHLNPSKSLNPSLIYSFPFPYPFHK